ncbi:MAG: 4Fe-4S binding protein [Promethearchaeota archaeon]
MLQSGIGGFEMITAIPIFILWIILIVLTTILLLKNKLKKRISLLLLLVSFVLGGIILGAVPNAVMPIIQVPIILSSGGSIQTIIPMLIILALLILSTFVVGRLFCGYACPLGAIQETCSKIKFKSKPKEQKNIKYKIETSQKTANIIRWIFLVSLIITSVMWSLSIIQIFNPFLGFQFFRYPIAFALIIPLISLIIIIIASVFIYRPWCRYLCPFGALATITGRFSGYKLARTDACTDCKLCEKICPTQEAFRDSEKGECYLCGRCIETCPQNALEFKKV